MVTGREATADDRVPIFVGEDRIESITEVPYLGSVIASSGRMLPDIDQWIYSESIKSLWSTTQVGVYQQRR